MKISTPTLQDVGNEGDRIAALLRQTAQQQQQGPSTNDVADSMISAFANSRNPNGGGSYNAYTSTMKTKQADEEKKQQNTIASEKDIYNYMLKAKQLGDQDTAVMKDGLDTLVGKDPEKQMQIIKYVKDNHPDLEINSTNYLQPAVEAMKSLGLKNDDKIFADKKNALSLQSLQSDINYKNAETSTNQQKLALSKKQLEMQQNFINGSNGAPGQQDASQGHTLEQYVAAFGPEAGTKMYQQSGEGVASTALSKNSAKNYVDNIIPAGKSSRDTLAMLDASDKYSVKTGPGTELSYVPAAAAASALGLKDAGDATTGYQLLSALKNNDILQKQILQKGSQTEGDAQRMILTSVNENNMPVANNILKAIMRRKAQLGVSTVQAYSKDEGSGFKNARQFEADTASKPLLSPDELKLLKSGYTINQIDEFNQRAGK